MNSCVDETPVGRCHRPTGDIGFAALLTLLLALGPACGSAENKNDQPDAGPTMCSIPGTMCDEDTICTVRRLCKPIAGDTTGICAEDAALRSVYGFLPDTDGSFVAIVTDITGDEVSLLDEINNVQYTLLMDLGGLSVSIQVGDRLEIDDYMATPHHRRLRLVRDGKLLFVGEAGGYGYYPNEGFEWMWSPEDREGVSLEIVDVGCGLVTDLLARFRMGLKVTAPGGESVVLGSGLATFLDLPAGRYLFVAASASELAVTGIPEQIYAAAYFMILLP